MPAHPTLYSHTRRIDGMHESVCSACLATIASHQNEAALAREEEEHVCKFAFLSKRSPSAHELPGQDYGRKQRTVHAGIW